MIIVTIVILLLIIVLRVNIIVAGLLGGSLLLNMYIEHVQSKMKDEENNKTDKEEL